MLSAVGTLGVVCLHVRFELRMRAMLRKYPPPPTPGAKALTAERHRVLDEVLGLIERGGNPNEIAVLCDELKEGIDTPEEPSR
jgi:hypothetical protein